ncbi:MAG: type II secretion system protein [Clostridiales bacterium]|nr:type II secretion system protein [Clostridiales bacterium]
MKKRKGFTLLEMVVVIAVVTIMTGAVTITVIQSVNRAQTASLAAEEHYAVKYDEARAQVDALRANSYGDWDGTYPPDPTETDPEVTETTAPPPTTTVAETTEALPILPEPNPNLDISWSVADSWSGVVVYEFKIVNLFPGKQTWETIAFIVPDGVTVNNYWMGSYELDGNVLSLHPADWIDDIANKGSITITIHLNSSGVFEITDFVVV